MQGKFTITKTENILAIGVGLLMVGGASLATVKHAVAEVAADFYRNKTLSIGVPNSAGGGYDVYARVLAHHISKHIPGGPNVVIQNVPAAGGMALANQLYNTSPRDGTYIGMVRGTVVHEQVFNTPQVQFDARKFAWIGNMNADYDGCIVSAASGITTLEDFYKREVVMGASGAGAQSYTFPLVYRDLLGMKLKVIAGYPGTPERMIALERGELDGFCGITISTFRSQLAELAQRGTIKLVAQGGVTKDPRYPDLPNVFDEAKTPDVKQALEFLFTPLAINRAIAAPPGTPADRVAVLRNATMQTMKDPAFVEEAEKLRLDITVMGADETASISDKLFTTPPAVVAKIKNLVDPTAK
jgi:tripartite-type tricarboxylate transporter receptor subunit TctC